MGLARHLLPQVAEIVTGHRQTVGPLRVLVNPVGDGERLGLADFGRGDEILLQFPPDAGGRLDGANGLGSVIAAIAVVTTPWSAARCGLNPAPIEPVAI